MQTKVGKCLVTIIANGGETSLNQDNLRLIPSFLILIFFVQIYHCRLCVYANCFQPFNLVFPQKK